MSKYYPLDIGALKVGFKSILATPPHTHIQNIQLHQRHVHRLKVFRIHMYNTTYTNQWGTNHVA